MQTNVTRLRRLLPPDVAIATTPQGYQLLADRAAVDVAAFTDHVVTAAAAPDDPRLRLRRLGAAPDLWCGRPYA